MVMVVGTQSDMDLANSLRSDPYDRRSVHVYLSIISKLNTINNKQMTYHNLRDKFGRFRKRKRTEKVVKRAAKKTRKKKGY